MPPAPFKTMLRWLRANPADLQGMPLNRAAAIHSFGLMLVTLPFYGFSMVVLAAALLKPLPWYSLLPLLAADYVLQWTLFPLCVYGILRLGQLNGVAFPAFVIANNWLTAINLAAIFLPLLLYATGIIGEDSCDGLINGIGFGISLITARWAVRLFGRGFGFGLMVFSLNNLMAQAISLATWLLLTAHGAAPAPLPPAPVS